MLEGGKADVRNWEPDGETKFRPVSKDAACRTDLDRQRIARDIRAGRLCQVNMSVPARNIILLAVMTRRGGSVKRNHTGVAKSMRMNKVVSAGRVVADVAVCWVERKSVICIIGASSILHLPVKACIVARISSKDLRCCMPDSEDVRLLDFFFSPVHPVEDRGEYLRKYIPAIRNMTRISGPA